MSMQPTTSNRTASNIRVLRIVTPSGKKQYMVFTRTVSSPVLQVDYGLVPADVDLRPPRVPPQYNERMECLSPEVLEDVPPGHFYFYETRTPHDVGPPLFMQLQQQGVIEGLYQFATRGPLAGKAMLVKVLLAEGEIAHSCMSGSPLEFRHWESPGHGRFRPCTSCSRIRGRLPVYFCSSDCQKGWHHIHKRDCGLTRKELMKHIEQAHKTVDPAPMYADRGRESQVDGDMSHLVRWPYERRLNGCQDMLPGF